MPDATHETLLPGLAAPMRAPIGGIVVLGDCLRPGGKGEVGGVDRPIRWLYNVLKRSLAAAAGLGVGLVMPTHSPSLAACLETLRAPADADAFWAAHYEGRTPLDPALDALLAEAIAGRFCVGYELPPYMVGVLERTRTPYVDLRIHPVRFMDDLMFAVRASAPESQASLAAVAVRESEVVVTAGLREAMCRFVANSSLPPHTLLVIGQRPSDATQIQDGSFFDAHPRATEIHAICAAHRAVLLKPHPHERDHSLLVVASGAPAQVLGATEDNIYRLFSLEQIDAVLTVNSSAAYEAAFFGKTVHLLGRLPIRLGWRSAAALPDCHYAIDDRVLTPDFWRLMLAPHMAVSPADGMRLPPKPNRLRIALDSFWNFQEIDTDRIPARPTS